MSNPWLQEAEAAVRDYKAGHARGEYPRKPTVGMCQKAARCLYLAVVGVPQPWARATAKLTMEAAIRSKKAIVGDGMPNAYHKAALMGKIVPGAELYLEYGSLGHVVTVVEVNGDPRLSLNVVKVFENTSSRRDGLGPGSCITSLQTVCGSAKSGRILAVVPVEDM